MEDTADLENQPSNFSENEKRLIEAADYLNSYLYKILESTVTGSEARMQKSKDEVETQQEKNRLIKLLESFHILTLRDSAANIFQKLSATTRGEESYDDIDKIRGNEHKAEFTPIEEKIISLLAFGKAIQKLSELENKLWPSNNLSKIQITKETRNRVFGFQLALGIKYPTGEPTDKLLPILEKYFPSPNPQPASTLSKAA